MSMTLLNSLHVRKQALGLILPSFTHFAQCLFPAGLCSVLEGRTREFTELWKPTACGGTQSGTSPCSHVIDWSLNPYTVSMGVPKVYPHEDYQRDGLLLKNLFWRALPPKKCRTGFFSWWWGLARAHCCLLPLCGQFSVLPMKGQIQVVEGCGLQPGKLPSLLKCIQALLPGC